MSSQTGAVGAGAFHPDPVNHSKRAQPRQQRVMARRCCRERPHGQQPTNRVDRSSDMHIEMRVDTTNNRARNFYDGHTPSLLSLNWVKGWHARPGKETVTNTLRLTASSITLPNGACLVKKPAT